MSDRSANKLTLAIPTLDRATYLDRAIVSCLAQRTPCDILVSDQGKSEATRQVMARYADNPNVRHLESPAENLWQNWRFAAENCETPYLAWVQDDDRISSGFSARAISAFEAWPEAHCWTACLRCSSDGINALWYAGNGPLVPMNSIEGVPVLAEGKLFTPIAYCTSMALSPAVAFRCGPRFSEVLASLPERCDLYMERLVLAAMGAKNPIVCDPFMAGYWIHHSANTCYGQRKEQPQQESRAIPWLDNLLDTLDEWRYPFRQWLDHLPLPHLAGCGGPVFAESFEQSRYCREMRELFTAAANACNQPQSGMPAEFGPVVVNTDILQPNRPMPKMPPVVEAFRYEEDMAEVAG